MAAQVVLQGEHADRALRALLDHLAESLEAAAAHAQRALE